MLIKMERDTNIKTGVKIYSKMPDITDVPLWVLPATIICARLGYVLWYDLSSYIEHPSNTLYLWRGGLSFHGGLLGGITALYLLCRKHRVNFFLASDLFACCLPIGLGLVRIGNFINGELFGRITNAQYGIIFPGGGPYPRHPSQLYESLLEGVILFIIMQLLYKNTKWYKKPGMLTGAFFMIYGLFRILVENFRQPDAQIGFILQYFTMGQILSIP